MAESSLFDRQATAACRAHLIHPYLESLDPKAAADFIASFTQPGEWVLDPFAGSGSVGVVCFLSGRNATLVDVNPLTMYLVEAKMPELRGHPESSLAAALDEMRRYDGEKFIPKCRIIARWYTEGALSSLGRIFGFIHNKYDGPLKPILTFAALEAARRLAKRGDAEGALEIQAEDCFGIVEGAAFRYLEAALDFKSQVERRVFRAVLEVYAPRNYRLWRPERIYDAVVTRLPGVSGRIAQSEVDLYWLGFSEYEVREMKRRELDGGARRVRSPTIDEYRQRISKRKRNLKAFDRYISGITGVLEKAGGCLKRGGYMHIEAGALDEKFPLWKMVAEYLEERGFKTCMALEGSRPHEASITLRKVA